MNRLFKFLIFSLILKTSLAGAIPIVEHTGSVEILDEQGNKTDFLIYRDDSDPKLFWWFPYQLVAAKDPQSLRPVINWTANTGAPHISFAVNLVPRIQWIETAVKKKVAVWQELPAQDVTLQPLPIQEVRLQLHGYHNLSEIGVTGLWFPVSDMLVNWMPETVYLTKDDNDALKRQYELGFGYAAFAINVHGMFQAKLTPFRFGRKFDTACVVDTLGEFQASELSSRLLFATISRLDLSCVNSRSNLGREPAPDELFKAWIAELKANNLLSMLDNGRYALGSVENLKKYSDLGERAFFQELPEEVGLFPFAVAVSTFHLRPAQ